MKYLKQIREKSGLTQVDVAKMLGISKQAYNNYERGRREADYETLLKLAEILGTTVDGLLTGTPSEPQILEPVPRDNVYQIPIYETVSAGFGAYADDCICGYMPLFIATREEAEQTMIIRVRGDSMYPVIPDGSRVQVRRQDYADNGQIVVMLIDGEEGVLKRYYLDDGRGEVRLESYNPTYPPRIFRGADIERLRLVGVAVSVIADLP